MNFCAFFAMAIGSALVFFDVDHTLIPGTSAEALFIQWLLLHGKISWRALSATACFFVRHRDDIGGTAIRGNKMYLKGMSVEQLNAYAKTVATQCIQKHLSTQGIAELRQLKREGCLVVLLSASPAVLIQYVKDFTEADDYIATALEVKDRLLTGAISGIHPYGIRKVSVALQYAKKMKRALSECGAYANAFSDLPLLRTVGTPVAVNPDRRLMAWARSNGWLVRRFPS